MIPRIQGGRELGVAYLGDVPEGYFTYFAGAEVSRKTEDTRFVKGELPAREYFVCGFEAENFEQLVTVVLNKVGGLKNREKIQLRRIMLTLHFLLCGNITRICFL